MIRVDILFCIVDLRITALFVLRQVSFPSLLKQEKYFIASEVERAITVI